MCFYEIVDVVSLHNSLIHMDKLGYSLELSVLNCRQVSAIRDCEVNLDALNCLAKHMGGKKQPDSGMGVQTFIRIFT